MDQPNNAPPQAGRGPGRKPDQLAYNITEGKDGKGYFNQIGAAWQHKDGQGYDIKLESVPVDGRVTLRELRDMRDERIQAMDQQAQVQPGPQQSQEVGPQQEAAPVVGQGYGPQP